MVMMMDNDDGNDDIYADEYDDDLHASQPTHSPIHSSMCILRQVPLHPQCIRCHPEGTGRGVFTATTAQQRSTVPS